MGFEPSNPAASVPPTSRDLAPANPWQSTPFAGAAATATTAAPGPYATPAAGSAADGGGSVAQFAQSAVRAGKLYKQLRKEAGECSQLVQQGSQDLSALDSITALLAGTASSDAALAQLYHEDGAALFEAEAARLKAEEALERARRGVQQGGGVSEVEHAVKVATLAYEVRTNGSNKNGRLCAVCWHDCDGQHASACDCVSCSVAMETEQIFPQPAAASTRLAAVT